MKIRSNDLRENRFIHEPMRTIGSCRVLLSNINQIILASVINEVTCNYVTYLFLKKNVETIKSNGVNNCSNAYLNLKNDRY